MQKTFKNLLAKLNKLSFDVLFFLYNYAPDNIKTGSAPVQTEWRGSFSVICTLYI